MSTFVEEFDLPTECLPNDITDPCFAQQLDAMDELKEIRDAMFYPNNGHIPNFNPCYGDVNQNCLYFATQSLGLMPRKALEYVTDELTKWGTLGVLGHFYSDKPFNQCDLFPRPLMAKLVGAQENEIALMNSLSTNLHLLLTSFYRPTPERCKIMYEEHIFPSDKYAIDSQLRLRGFQPECASVVLKGRETNCAICEEDILNTIEEVGDSVALIYLGTVQYYTGQHFNIPLITSAGHRKGCTVGFCLAHAVGNVPLNLHCDDVDFAVWCTYKYLCGGPGAVGCIFVHERFFCDDFARLDGWWGSVASSRMKMFPEIDRDYGAGGFRLSTPCPMQIYPALATLELIDTYGFDKILRKSRMLTRFLEILLCHLIPDVKIITPSSPQCRGAQLSLLFPQTSEVGQIQCRLQEKGVIVDVRGSCIMRVTPSPLYNTFCEILRFVTILRSEIYACE